MLTLSLPMPALAVDPESRSPQPLGLGDIDPQVLPYALDDARQVTVMLEMQGDPVAVAQSKAAGRELSRAQRDRIKAELKGRQDAIVDDIAARGGQVLAQLQSAYNGVKVSISRADVASLASLPNVVAVRAIQQHTPGNATSVPYIGVPGVWEDLGYTGAGVKVAVIDTGIDYTHANFGGPGTVEAFELADASDTDLGDAGDAGIFGPDGSSKVKGGWDFVGDAYNASSDDAAETVPQPDPDPLDCNGHGSHVAGSAVGYGVNADGTTYEGPYDATTHENEFDIGPGVAPEAELYALRVFGCAGSTDVTVDAIDWAVDNEMDVINMSLGSSFGRRDDPSAVASTNAAAAGVIVVASAGNSGPSQYITGSPGTGSGAIATAAVDSTESFPGVVLDLSTGTSVTAISANGVAPPDDTVYRVVVLTDDPATPPPNNEALGCALSDYTRMGITTDEAQEPILAVTLRGTCARVARAVFGQQAGADAVAMINTDQNYPPYEGPIAGNPDTGESYEVTIPFLGVRGVLGAAATPDGDNLVAADGGTATTTQTTIPNPGFKGFASFSSGGPTNGDSFLKPDIAAPGVSIASTSVGTGNKAAIFSGTSMASPHIAGVAALVRQAHPDWDVADVKAAITNSGSPAGLPGYSVTRAGAGLVTPTAAVGTDVVALGDLIPADASAGLAAFHNSNLSFGFAELGADFSETRAITVKNHGTEPVTLTPSAIASSQSSPASVSFGSASVTVDPGSSEELEVTLTVDASTAGDSAEFREVSGNIELAGDGLTLRVPYLLVPRALSDIETSSGPITPSAGGTSVTVSNVDGQITGAADFYQWGLVDGDDVNESVLGGSGYDLQAAGVQSFAAGTTDAVMYFALSTHDRWSNAAVNEFDILIDTTGDAAPDFVIIGFDLGALTTGSFNGRLAVFRLNLATGALSPLSWAVAPTDSSTVLLPIRASQLGLTPADGTFTYSVQTFSLEGAGTDEMAGAASYNPFDPAMEKYPFVEVQPGASDTEVLSFDPLAWAKQKPLGVMVVSTDDAAGAEAQLIEVPGKKKGR